MQQFKKLLYLILLLPMGAFAQSTTTLPTGTTAYTPQFRYKGTDSLKSIWVYTGTGYNRWYTATEINARYGKSFKSKIDSVLSANNIWGGTNTFQGSINIQTISGSADLAIKNGEVTIYDPIYPTYRYRLRYFNNEFSFIRNDGAGAISAIGLPNRTGTIALVGDSPDSATIAASYIRNRDTSTTSQTANINITGHAKIADGLIFQNGVIKPNVLSTDTANLRPPSMNLGWKGNIVQGHTNTVFGGDITHPNKSTGSGTANSKNTITGYDNWVKNSIANHIFSMHSFIDSLANHGIIAGGSYDTIYVGAKAGIFSSQNSKVKTAGAFSGLIFSLNSETNADYSHIMGNNDTVGVGKQYGHILGTRRGWLSGVSSIMLGGDMLKLGKSFNADFSGMVGGLNNRMGDAASSSYSFMGGGRDNYLNGDYSSTAGRKDTVSANNAFAYGYNAYAAHSGAMVFNADNAGTTQAKSTATNQFTIRAANGVRLLGGAVTMANYTTQSGIPYFTNTTGLLGVTAQGATNTVLHGNGGSAPSFSQIVGGDLSSTIAIPSGATATTQSATTLNTSIATTAFVGAMQNYTASGTGAATTIVIPHGLTGISGTSKVIVQPLNAASAGVTYVTIDATNVNVNYTVAPVIGTNNLSYTIHIKP